MMPENAGVREGGTPFRGSAFRYWLASLSAAAFFGHLVVGAWYATHAEGLSSHISLRSSGESYLASFHGWGTDHERDDALYNRTAIQIRATGIPRDRDGAWFLHAPLYSYFIAGCYLLGGVRLWPLVLAQAALSALACWWVGRAAFELGRGSPLAGLLAAGLYAVNLRISMYVGMVNPTSLVLCCAAWALWQATRVAKGAAPWAFVGAVVMGMYSQATFFVVGGAAVLWLAFRAWNGPTRASAGWGAVAILVFALAKVWVGAQALRTVSSGSGGHSVLWEANNPYYENMGWARAWERRPGNPWTTWVRSEEQQARFDEYLGRARQMGKDPGLLWIRENPGAYARLCLVRFRTTLGPSTGQMSPRNRMLSTVFWLVIFPAGAAGLWVSRRESEALLAALVILALTAFSTLVVTEWYLRYRLPMDLTLIVFAGVGYAAMNRRWRNAAWAHATA
jgi:hypothetical protein